MSKNRKTFYWLFKSLGILVACLLPIWAILEKFPVWTYSYGRVRSMGVGGILILIVLLIVFRKTIFNYLVDKLKLKHAPPIVVWIAMLIASYILIFIGNFVQDLTTVFWMGLVGCAVGTVLTYIAESRFGEEKDDG